MMQTFLLTTDEAMARWQDIAAVLMPAMRFNQGKYQLSDILNEVAMNYAQVWVTQRGDSIQGVTVTTIVKYPQKRVLFVTMLAGKDFCLWDNVVKDCLIPYAEQAGCDSIEFLGRKGWIQRAQSLGFGPALTLFELDLKDQGGH